MKSNNFLVPIIFFLVSFSSLTSQNDTSQPIVTLEKSQSQFLNSLETTSWSDGTHFSGRVAFISNQPIGKRDFEYLARHNEDFRIISLWKRQIPTLETYSHTNSPRLFLFVTRVLNSNTVKQKRSMIQIHSTDFEMLKSIGTTTVVIDEPYSSVVTQNRNENGFTREIIKLDASLVYGYFVDIIEPISSDKNRASFQDIASALKKRNLAYIESDSRFRFSNSKYGTSYIKFRDGYINISAKNFGASALVIPFEYSNCLEVKNREVLTNLKAIYPVNLVQTLILFRDSVEIELRYRTNPFLNPLCRFRDYLGFRKLL
jgi:hypothetical protein